MKMTTIQAETKLIEFVLSAQKYIKENEFVRTYTVDGKITQGEYFAIKWGGGDDCLLVFKIDEDFEPINFQNILSEYEREGHTKPVREKE